MKHLIIRLVVKLSLIGCLWISIAAFSIGSSQACTGCVFTDDGSPGCLDGQASGFNGCVPLNNGCYIFGGNCRFDGFGTP